MCGGWKLLTEEIPTQADRIKALKEMFGDNPEYDFSKTGQMIELIHTDDPYTHLTKGDIGVIELVKHHVSMENQVWVKWNEGSNLMLLEGKDQYREIENDQ